MNDNIAWIILSLVGLAVTATAYNRIIDGVHERLGFLPFASLWVTGGVLITLGGSAIIAWIVNGWEMAAHLVGVMSISFASSGIPMILGNIRRDTNRGDHE